MKIGIQHSNSGSRVRHGMTQHKMHITPAILEQDFNIITDDLGLMRGHAHTVQIDICDGVFVPSVTWPYTQALLGIASRYYDSAFREIVQSEGEIGMPYCEEINIELDLMVSDPKGLMSDLLTLGPSKIIFHIESLKDSVADMQALRKLAPGMVSFGIAIGRQTPLETIFPIIDEGLVQSVQCMGIKNIGVQGEAFDEGVLDTVRTLREKYPTLHISVDGGIKKEHVLLLKQAGATEAVVGSGIWNTQSPIDALKELKALV